MRDLDNPEVSGKSKDDLFMFVRKKQTVFVKVTGLRDQDRFVSGCLTDHGCKPRKKTSLGRTLDRQAGNETHHPINLLRILRLSLRLEPPPITQERNLGPGR